MIKYNFKMIKNFKLFLMNSNVIIFSNLDLICFCLNIVFHINNVKLKIILFFFFIQKEIAYSLCYKSYVCLCIKLQNNYDKVREII